MKLAALLVVLSTGVAFADDLPIADAEQPIVVQPPALAPVIYAPMPGVEQQAVAPQKECDNFGGYVEPALFGDGETGEFRHGLGLDFGRCAEVGLHVGLRLDIGGHGGYAGGEAELLFGRPSARIGFNLTSQAGSQAGRTTVGARLRLTNVWIGADLVRSSPYEEMTYEPGVPDRQATSLIFGIGLGGDAGKGFAKAEMTVLYAMGAMMGN